jgi:uncharacterized delta-60 repeat protein
MSTANRSIARIDRDSNGRKSSRRRHSWRPRLELLEDRTLLSAGMLDPTFGTGGEVFSPPRPVSFSWLAIQPDGRILASAMVRSTTGGFQDVGILRFNQDGSADTTFGTGGLATVDFEKRDFARGIFVSDDGKITVVATCDNFNPLNAPAVGVARLNPDGSLDPSFGTGGKVLTPIVGYRAFGSAQQPDGSVVVGCEGADSFLVLRFTSTGSLDASFGNGGEVVTSVSSFGFFYNYPSVFDGNLAMQADHRIVVGGDIVDNSGLQQQVVLARYNQDGSLDELQTTAVNQLTALASAPGQKLIEAGIVNDTPGGREAVVRLNRDLSVDPTFNTGHQLDNFGIGAVTVQSDGKVIMAGSSADPSDPTLYVFRDNPDGSPDLSWGTGGVATAPFALPGIIPEAVAVQSDGKVVVEGRQLDFASALVAFVLVRFLGSPDDPGIQSGAAASSPLGETSSTSQPVTAASFRPLSAFVSLLESSSSHRAAVPVTSVRPSAPTVDALFAQSEADRAGGGRALSAGCQ